MISLNYSADQNGKNTNLKISRKKLRLWGTLIFWYFSDFEIFHNVPVRRITLDGFAF